MPKISDSAIAQYAAGAGLSGDAVAIAVAVAIAESGGDTGNHTVSAVDNSYGLWQINMLSQMGPDRRARYGLSSNDQLFDPATNARVMASISNGGKQWTDWTTYTRGTYRLYLARGQAVATGATGTGTTPVSVSASLSSLSDTLNILSTPDFWKRLGIFLAGVALLFYGILKLNGGSSISSQLNDISNKAIKAAVLK